MLIADYAIEVAKTDEFRDHDTNERRRIAIYGLVSEIGSVISAVKKRRLGEGGPLDSIEGRLTRHELREELGDTMWYCFALAAIEVPAAKVDILQQQIAKLETELHAESPVSSSFRGLLPGESLKQFEAKAQSFPKRRQRTFQDFQELAFLTARTQGDELVGVCLGVLMQYGAQLMRKLMPEEERRFHTDVQDRQITSVLGEIGWHLSAIATVYALGLDEIAEFNIEKAKLRRATDPTPLHDEAALSGQRFPRKFEIKFLTVGHKRSRMYFEGRKLGDDLTDNNYDPDGYRFHDVFHLANVAHLGWSPVIRALMGLKRKDPQNPKIDEVEDGARAKIIEEAILKVIHSEGASIAAIAHPDLAAEDRPMFTEDIDIPLSFFKLIHRFTERLEVNKNSFDEWKRSIRAGNRIFHDLAKEGQGTVSIDLNGRTIAFKPEVYVDIVGPVAGIGSCAIPLSEFGEPEQTKARLALTDEEKDRLENSNHVGLAGHFAAKRAILQALGLDQPRSEHFAALSLTETDPGKFSVKASSPLQEMMWSHGVIAFKTSLARSQNSVYCTALASSDISQK